MPSKENIRSVTDKNPPKLDIDDLVYEIKENLRLKAKPSRRPKTRASPYDVPSSTEKCRKPTSDTQDPYELLQLLLKENKLIQEAVTRLQFVPRKKLVYYESDEELRTPPFPFTAVELQIQK